MRPYAIQDIVLAYIPSELTVWDNILRDEHHVIYAIHDPVRIPAIGLEYLIECLEERKQRYQLLLHPLSRLQEEITVKSPFTVVKGCIMSDMLTEMADTTADKEFIEHCVDMGWKDIDWIGMAPHWAVRTLIDCKFDLFDLFERKMARAL